MRGREQAWWERCLEYHGSSKPWLSKHTLFMNVRAHLRPRFARLENRMRACAGVGASDRG